MRIIQVYRPTNDGTEYNMVYIDEELFNFLNIDKLNCISEDELNKGIENFMNSEDDENLTDKDLDRYASDVQNGDGYYDESGTFHYYSNTWD